MKKEKLPNLDEIEAQVRQKTIKEHRDEIKIIESLLNCYLAGFRMLKEFKVGTISNLEIAWLLLLVRSFNSFRCAFDLIQIGYCNQAVTLIRSAEEDYLTCRHCEIDQGTIEALLEGKGNLKRFAIMAKDISNSFYTNWAINYGQLSEITHPRQLAMGMVASWRESKVNLGGNYNANHFTAVCHSLLKSAVGMTEFLLKLLSDNAERWYVENIPVINEASKYVVRISNELGKQEEIGNSSN